jgi:hypothetical protein
LAYLQETVSETDVKEKLQNSEQAVQDMIDRFIDIVNEVKRLKAYLAGSVYLVGSSRLVANFQAEISSFAIPTI